jgi:hypothetical protein
MIRQSMTFPDLVPITDAGMINAFQGEEFGEDRSVRPGQSSFHAVAFHWEPFDSAESPSLRGCADTAHGLLQPSLLNFHTRSDSQLWNRKARGRNPFEAAFQLLRMIHDDLISQLCTA